MKKPLLTLSLGLASLAMTAQTYEVTQDWIHKSGDTGFTFAAAADARWAAAHNGTIYVADKKAKVVNAYTKDGQTALATSTAGRCLTSDEAGNLILQNALWGTGSVTYKILPAGKTTAADLIDLKVTPPAGCAQASMHTIGRAIGNVLSPEGGVFYTYGDAQTSISKIFVANGKQDATKSAAIAVAKPTHKGGTQSLVQPTNSDLNATDNFIYRIRNVVNHFCKPDGNSFANAGTNSSIGGDIVTLGGVQYTVEPSGENYSDEFIIVNRKTNKVVYTHAKTAPGSGQQATPLIFEKVDETTANLYQYALGQYVAKYTFKVVPPTPQTAYIIGEVDNQVWNPTQGLAIQGFNDTYVGYAYFKAGANFGIATKLGNDANDWNTLNANRYGHSGGDAQPVPGIAQPQTLAKNTNAIKCPVAGYYKITANLSAGKESITIDYVDKLRIAGMISYINYNPLADWDLSSNLLVASKDNASYSFNINGLYLEDNDQLIFTPVVDNGGNWDNVNKFRIGGFDVPADIANTKNIITTQMAKPLALAVANNDGSGKQNIIVNCNSKDQHGNNINAGAFNLIIDLENMNISTGSFSGVEENVAEKASVTAHNGTIVVNGGNVTSIYSISGQLIVANSCEKSFNVAKGIYIVNVDGKAHKVIVR